MWRSRSSRQHRSSEIRIEPLEPRLVLSLVLWDGGGDGTHWKDPLNWDGDAIPGVFDDVVIDVATDPTVVLDGASTGVRSLQAHERLEFGNGTKLTLTALSEFHADVIMAPSSGLNGDGDAVFHAQLECTSASLYGAGLMTVSATGQFVLLGFNTFTRSLMLEGSTEWRALKVTLSAGVVVTNRGDFIADSDSAMEIVSSGGPATFSQEGTFTKRGTGEMLFTVGTKEVGFDTLGPLSVEAGALTLGGPGMHQAVMTINGGASLRLVDDHELDPGASILGDGVLAVGTVDIDVLVSVGALEVVSGTARLLTEDFHVSGGVTVDGGFLEFHVDTTLQNLALVSSGISGPASLTIGQSMVWAAGSMRGTGITTISEGAILEIDSSSGLLLLQRTLINRGVVDWRDGQFHGSSDGTLENHGLVRIRPAGSDDGPGILNYGEVRVQGGGTAHMLYPFENHGQLILEEGTLELAGGGLSTMPITVDAMATLSFHDVLFTLPAESPISGQGRLMFDGAARQQVYAPINIRDMFISGFAEFFASVTTQTGFSMHGGEVAFHGPAYFGEDQPLQLTSGIVDFGANDLLFSTGLIKGTLVTAGLLEFSDDVVWEYLEISGGGLLRIPSGVTLSIEGDFRRVLGVDIENHGRIVWAWNTLEMQGVTIDSDGLIELDVPASLVTAGTGSLINRGTIRKFGEGGAILGRRFDQVVFTNLGEVLVEDGVLSVVESTNFDETTGLLSGGVWLVSGFGSLNFASEPLEVIASDASVSIIGQNSRIDGIESLASVVGSLELRDGAKITVNPGGGILTQAGSIRVDVGSVLTVAGDLVQESTAHTIVEFEHSHPQVGFGRLVAGTITVGGDFTALAVNGYMPAEGTMHLFMQADAATGEFEVVTLPDAAPGDKWALRYDTDGVTLLHTDLTDMDLNGIVNTTDFLIFLNLWVADDPGADANGDGVVDVLDFLFWLSAWSDG